MRLSRRSLKATTRRVLVVALAASLVAACSSDDGGGGRSKVEFFPAGGVSEQMRSERREARLNLEHTVVSVLEAAGTQLGDTGDEAGVDEFVYHFEKPTELRVSLDRFEQVPTLVALDETGIELARVDADSGPMTFSAVGESTFRFIHPRAGDATADPILIFFRPVLPSEDPGPESAGGGAGPGPTPDPTDVADLKAGKDCVRCNLEGLSWNVCPQGFGLAGVNLSYADFTSAVLACQMFESKGNTPTLLTGASFTGANISQVLFKEVDLTDARFTGAFFDVSTLDSVTATSTDFSNIRFTNSMFGAAKGSGSSAYGANFSGAQIIENSCLSVYDLREANFSGAKFDSSSSVHGAWFGGANLFGVTFDGTRFQYDSILPNCGQPTTCTTVTVSGLCTNCPCTTDLGCLEVGGVEFCVRNQGVATVSGAVVCESPPVLPDPVGVIFKDVDLAGVSFAGADLTNSTFASTTLDSTNDFAGAILAGVDFTNQDLGKSVDLSGAFLSATTNFAGAVLSAAPASEQGVNLSCVTEKKTGGCQFPAETTQFMGANMQYAQFNNAGLSQANLENANLANASLVGADLTFASLKGATLAGATLGAAPGTNAAANMRGAFMINANLTDADLRSVDFNGAHLYGSTTAALFVRAKLDSADFTDAILAGAVFTSASLTAAEFNGAQLVNADFELANLANAKFDNAYLQGADFSTASSVTGISLSNAAVTTNLRSTMCTLTSGGVWTYKEQDGTPYTFQYGLTMLVTDGTTVCPDGEPGPCSTGDSLCPLMSGPFPPVPPCVPTMQFCYENCETPPCFKDVPNPTTGLCPFPSNCG